MRSHFLIAAAMTVILGAATACAQDMKTPAMTADSGLGKIMIDSKKMTLYTFDKDTPGKSVCNGQCAVNWPPLMASADAKTMGDWSIVTRDDGMKQWAYKGKPLYAWIKDTKPGDTTGDGFNKVWHVAHP